MNFAAYDDCIEPDTHPFDVNPTYEFHAPQWVDLIAAQSDDPALWLEHEDDGFFDHEHPFHEPLWEDFSRPHSPFDCSPGYLKPLQSFSYPSDAQSHSPFSLDPPISPQRSHAVTSGPKRLPQRVVLSHDEKPHENAQGTAGLPQTHVPQVRPHVRIAGVTSVTETVEEEEEGTEESEEESSDGESMDLVSALLRQHNSKITQTRKRGNKKTKQPGKVIKPRARKTAGGQSTTDESASGGPSEKQADVAPPTTQQPTPTADIPVKEPTLAPKHNIAQAPKVSRVSVPLKEAPPAVQPNGEIENGAKRAGGPNAKPPPTTVLRVTSSRTVLTTQSGVAARKTEVGPSVKAGDGPERPRITNRSRVGVSPQGVGEVVMKGKPAAKLPNKAAGTLPSPPTGIPTLTHRLPVTQAPSQAAGVKFAPLPQPPTRTQQVAGTSAHGSGLPGAQKPTFGITQTTKSTPGGTRKTSEGRIGAGAGLTGAAGLAKKPPLYMGMPGVAQRANIENVIPHTHTSRPLSSGAMDKYSRNPNADIENMMVSREGAVAKAAANQIPARGLAHRAPLHDRNHNQQAFAPSFPSKPENRTKATLSFCPSGSQPTKATGYGHADKDTDDLKNLLAQHNSRVTGLPSRKFL